MSTILDRIVVPHGRFRPKTARELFALRLAHKLREPNAADHYLQLCNQHAEGHLVTAYQRTIKRGGSENALAQRFHEALTVLNGHQANGHHTVRLAAFKIERRSIAVAVCQGERLDHTQTRQLSSVREKAERSAAGFVNWILSHLQIESAAVEFIESSSDIQRAVLSRVVVQTLRESGIPLWEIPKQELFAGYCHPRLRSRRELRGVISSIWPALEGGEGVLDAAALGLYVQTERLFIIN